MNGSRRLNRRIAFATSAAMFLGLSGVSGQALGAKKKKDEAATPAGPALPSKGNLLSNTKTNALKSEKVRSGPAKYNDNALNANARDAKADEKRDEEIEELEKLIPTQSGATKADLLFQLSELWWEKSKFVYITEMARFEQEE